MGLALVGILALDFMVLGAWMPFIPIIIYLIYRINKDRDNKNIPLEKYKQRKKDFIVSIVVFGVLTIVVVVPVAIFSFNAFKSFAEYSP